MRNLLTIILVTLALAACGDTYLTTIPCDCSDNFFNCDDFATQEDAQNCYDYCLSLTGDDVHNMDGDNNGLVCEAAFSGGSSQQQPTVILPTEPPLEDFTYDELGLVLNVIDGDTIDVDLGGRSTRVRYIGVNTPERDEPCYGDATNANASLVEGNTVYLVRDVSDTDRFDRLLRYIYVEQGDDLVFVNAELVAQGFAESVRYEPDTFYFDLFEQLEADAFSGGLGCHPTGIFDN